MEDWLNPHGELLYRTVSGMSVARQNQCLSLEFTIESTRVVGAIG